MLVYSLVSYLFILFKASRKDVAIDTIVNEVEVTVDPKDCPR